MSLCTHCTVFFTPKILILVSKYPRLLSTIAPGPCLLVLHWKECVNSVKLYYLLRNNYIKITVSKLLCEFNVFFLNRAWDMYSLTGTRCYVWAEAKHRLSVIDHHIVIEGPIRLPGPLPLTSPQVMRENYFTSLILILTWSLVMVSLFFSSKCWKAAGGNGPSACPCCRHSNHWGNYLQSKDPQKYIDT